MIAEKSQYLGSFVCNILGDKAYLYKTPGGVQAEIYNSKGEVTRLSDSQIVGGRERDMSREELIQLVTTVAAPLLFARYQSNGSLRIFPLDFREIQKNQFLKPRVTFPANYFKCVRRERLLNKLQKLLRENSIVVVVNDPKVPLKRVGKTELAMQFFEEHRKEYSYAFWIQAFDPWFLERDMEKMAQSLQITAEKISAWLNRQESSSLVVFDGVERLQAIQKYLPEAPKGHIVISCRDPLYKDHSLAVGLFTPKEGVDFLSLNKDVAELEARQLAQSLGYVPSSLYRALETIEAENLSLSNYLTYYQGLLNSNEGKVKAGNRLLARNENFVGREPELVALEESFSRNKPIVITVISGLGGVGKTQIALQYGYRACSAYNLIWWINCGNIQLSYDKLAVRLGVEVTDEERKQQNGVIKKVNRHLQKTPGWLLIFDDAENEEGLEGLLPESGGHILITSRNPIWDKTQADVVKVEAFKREDSVDLILKVTGRFDREKFAYELADLLQNLPLAIAQAAAYIDKTKISIQEYIEDFTTVHQALWNRETSTNNYEYTVNVTWNISMKKIQEQEQNDHLPMAITLPLMEVCSFFAPNNIPVDELLLRWLNEQYEVQQIDTKACLADLGEALKRLEKFSMISVGEGDISVHMLVQTVIRDGLTEKKYQNHYQQALDLVAFQIEGFDRNQSMQWNQVKKCLPHGMAIAKAKTSIELIDLSKQYAFINELGEIYRFFGDLLIALEIEKSCLAVAEEWHRMSPDFQSAEAVANSSNNRGLGLVGIGKYHDALVFFNKALQIWLDKYGEDHLYVATSYNNIGDIYREIRDYDQAYLFYQKGLKIRSGKKDEDLIGLISIYNNTAEVCRLLERIPEAFNYCRLALNIGTKLSENHPSIARSYHQLGNLYCSIGSIESYKNALESYEKALKMEIEVAGSETNPNIPVGYFCIGRIYLICQDDKEAYGCFLEAVNGFEKINENHPNLVEVYKHMGQICFTYKLYEKALEFCQKALKIGLQEFDANDSTIAECYDSIGQTYFALKDYPQALTFYQRALEIFQKYEGTAYLKRAEEISDSLAKCEKLFQL